ncbi:MAG: class I SAM-dependent methyltransferase [Sandaracinaceae bacterium]
MATRSERPVYPTWIRSTRVVRFWLLALGMAAIAVVASLFWRPAAALALLALPFLYIAILLSLVAHRLGPRGGDLQAKIHDLLIEGAGAQGGLLDVGCGSGQLLIRFAEVPASSSSEAVGGRVDGPTSRTSPLVGLDYWGDDWEYSKAQAERNAWIEGVTGLDFVRGSASRLPFDDATFARVVSNMTFHEVGDVADKTASVVEAIRVLAPGGRFAFVDLFDDRAFYPSRDRVLAVIREAGGEVDAVEALTERLDLRWPMSHPRVLKHAVLVTGTKRR